jgi:protein gp37
VAARRPPGTAAKDVMGKTSIEWTDHSINPIRARDKQTGAVGHFCVKISPGCRDCYASRMQRRFKMHEFVATNRQKVEMFFDDSKVLEVIRRRKPTKWFWCDMTDMFGDWVPDEWIDKCCAAAVLTPGHTHQFLTKRAERMAEYFAAGSDALIQRWAKAAVDLNADGAAFMGLFRGVEPFAWPLPNLWLGVSVENQKELDERITHLLRINAAVRYVSAEPLLGSLDFTYKFDDGGAIDILDHAICPACYGGSSAQDCDRCGGLREISRPIDWVICGGESGKDARPMHPEWARLLYRQCKAHRVPFFFKQWGAWLPYELRPSMPPFYETPDGFLHDGHGLNILDPETGDEGKGWDAGFWCIEEKLPDCAFKRVGKKAAGNLLDGERIQEFPA